MKVYVLVDFESVTHGHGDFGTAVALKTEYPAFLSAEAAIEYYVQAKIEEKKAGGLQGMSSVEAVESFYRKWPSKVFGMEVVG